MERKYTDKELRTRKGLIAWWNDPEGRAADWEQARNQASELPDGGLKLEIRLIRESRREVLDDLFDGRSGLGHQ